MPNSSSTTARIKAKGNNEAPHLGFDRAFKQALAQLSHEIGTGDYSVSVEFSADVKVSNPGVVGWWAVTLTRP
jgi:hypothetical protein